MHIAVDGNEANVSEKVGVSMYTFELLKYFARVATEDCRFTVVLRNQPSSDLPPQNDFFTYSVVPGKILWRDLFLPAHLATSSGKFNVFFSPAHYTPRFTQIPVVVTIHDVSYLHYPEEFLKKDLYKLKNWTDHAISQAKRIIAVSDFTRNDIIKNYNTNPEKIITIHNGFNASHDPHHNNPDKDDQYILYVGTLQPRKNIDILLNSFSELLKDHANLKLRIVGKKGWLYENLFETTKKLDIENNVDFLGYVPNEELEKLYDKASAFVLPSLYEGFGIPVLEAMSHGVPVLAAKGSALVEIGGDACVYFDPHDTMELKRKMQEVLSSNELAGELRKKGLERVKQFNWEKCAQETLAVLQRT